MIIQMYDWNLITKFFGKFIIYLFKYALRYQPSCGKPFFDNWNIMPFGLSRVATWIVSIKQLNELVPIESLIVILRVLLR